MRAQTGSQLLRYGLALVATALASLVAELFRPVFSQAPFLPFLLAVAVSAYAGGWGPGLAATVLGALAVNYLLMPPIYELSITGWGDVVRLGFFVLVAAVISGLCGLLHAAGHTAEARAAALQVSEERFRRIVETAHEGIWSQDATGRIEYVNPRLTQLLGYPAADMLGRPWWEFLHPEDQHAGKDSWKRRRRGITERYEIRFRRQDGADLWAIVSTNPVVTDQGVFIGALALLTDITQRKRAEEELRRAKDHLEAQVAERTAALQKANALLQAELMERQQTQEALENYTTEVHDLYNHAPCGYHSVDADGRFVRINATEAAWLGYTREELLDRPLFDLLTPASARTFAASFVLLKERGWVRDVELHLVRKDGTVLPVLLNETTIRDEAGRFVMSRSTTVDLTERKRIEAELQEREWLLAEAQQLAQLGSWAWDLAADQVTWSDQLYRIFGLSPGGFDATFRAGLGRIHPDDRERLQAVIDAARRDRKPFTAEGRIVRPDGTIRALYCQAEVIPAAPGRHPRMVGICQDITERKRTEEELRQARAAAEAANRAKSAFLAIVSHEIRNPLQVILTMTDLLAEAELTVKQHENLQLTKAAAHSLLAVINDLLDFSKIEAGKLALDDVPFPLSDRLGKVLKAQALRGHPQGLELVCYVDPAVPDVVVGDPNRLGQILTNLVGNAVKFTPRGEVAVRVEATPVGPEEVELHVSVADTGIGIAANKLPVIFQPFEQAGASTTRQYGGTGLGLAIAAKLVSLMGGRLWAESEVGRGSTFHFTARFGVPLCPAAGLTQLQLAGLRDRPVLVVDRHAATRRCLVETLAPWGLRPRAVDGAAAARAALAEAVAAERPYALVLLDAHLPAGDGPALAADLRRQAAPPATVLLLASTDGPTEIARYQDQGIAAWLTKPVLAPELRATLLAVLGRSPPAPADGAPTCSPVATRALHILVAEDNPINQVLMVQLLEKLGHTAVTASSGPEAIAALDQQPFDAVLMDVQMPEMTGLEATAYIRQREKGTGHHLPILAVTAYAMTGDRERCLQAGMDGYLAKPLQAADLVEALARLVPVD